MIEEKNFGLYLNILCQTLQKKNSILDEILKEDQLQAEMAKSDTLKADDFQSLIDRKTSLLEELEYLDNGFELSYNRVKDVFPIYKDRYQRIIQLMQENIIEISKKVFEIQRLELQNKDSIELKFFNMRKKIKDYNVSSKSISNYYKNMSNSFNGESHFMDKKK